MFGKMEDLLQSQIKKSCHLALPNGLKELMSDISREVLRAQPNDIYNFITDYLSVLLVTRENLTIAAKVCEATCRAPCELTLEEKLRDIGLCNDDVVIAARIIMEHLQGPVNEGNLLLKLLRTTYIEESMLPAIQETIRSAFIENNACENKALKPLPDCEDEVTEAANHTLRIYANSSPTNEQYDQMARRIQAAYRAYGVRRELSLKKDTIKQRSSNIKDTQNVKYDDIHVDIKEPDVTKSQRNHIRTSVTTESSTSLAGSYVKLPKYTPYSAHDIHEYDSEELLEQIHSHTDYTEEPKNGEKVRFHEKIEGESLEIEDDVLEAGDESDGTVEEVLQCVESDGSVHEISDGDEIENVDENEIELSECSNEIAYE